MYGRPSFRQQNTRYISDARIKKVKQAIKVLIWWKLRTQNSENFHRLLEDNIDFNWCFDNYLNSKVTIKIVNKFQRNWQTSHIDTFEICVSMLYKFVLYCTWAFFFFFLFHLSLTVYYWRNTHLASKNYSCIYVMFIILYKMFTVMVTNL